MSRSLPRVFRWALLLAAVPVAVWVIGQGQRLIAADLASAAARNWVMEHVASATGTVPEVEWESSLRAIEASLNATPDDPDLHERLGDLYTVAGQRDWKLPDARRKDYRQAADAYREAARLCPSEAQTWAMLAAASQLAQAPTGEVQSAWANALRLGPYEEHVRPTLLQVVVADWPAASPEMQAWAKALFDHGSASVRREINSLAKAYGIEFTADGASDR